MSDPSSIDSGRRRSLLWATGGLGAIGTAALAVPFVGGLQPSARARAAGAPVTVDISKIEPGQQLTFEWRGKPVWVVHRTETALSQLTDVRPRLLDPDSDTPQQPAYARNDHRSIRPDILVLIGICTHLGCSPTYLPEVTASWQGGWLCSCHGSLFDLAGRVFSGVPAPSNLEVPPHHYASDDVIVIGEEAPA